jgi:membrane fusion protein (multidrug efflux system)
VRRLSVLLCSFVSLATQTATLTNQSVTLLAPQVDRIRNHRLNPRRPAAAHLILLLAVLSLAGWLGWKWWFSLSHVSTDNAQIESHIVPVPPKVGGFVAEVAVKEHQAVEAGDLLVRIDDRDYKVKLAQAEAALAQVKASRETATSAGEQVTATSAGLRAALAKVDAARAMRDLAANQLADTRVLAPASGTIGGQER